jgi:hypothetical protein
VTLSVAVEEVESVVGESPQQVALSVQYSESVPVAETFDRKLAPSREAPRSTR